MELHWKTGKVRGSRKSFIKQLNQNLDKKRFALELLDLPLELESNYRIVTFKTTNRRKVRELIKDDADLLKTVDAPTTFKQFIDGSKVWIRVCGNTTKVVVAILPGF